MTGNTIEKFDPTGIPVGTFGGGYSCDPGTLAFDAAGNTYVGQASCLGSVLKFSATGQPLGSYAVAGDRAGAFKVELAPDGCTLFYTSWSAYVRRFDVCTNTQLPDFNLAPLDAAAQLRVLPDGGVLVATAPAIVRLDASGAIVRSYGLDPSIAPYWVGLDLVGDGTFWATDKNSSYGLPFQGRYVYRFDLATGAVLQSFSTGTTVVDVVVMR